jgi:hypothetical protein
VTSVGTNLASPPACLIAAALASPWSSAISAITTRALAREQQRRGAADAAPAARDQRHLARQPRHVRLLPSSVPTPTIPAACGLSRPLAPGSMVRPVPAWTARGAGALALPTTDRWYP